MPALALILIAVFLVVVFPLRSLRRKLRFGSAGRAVYDRRRPGHWWAADLLFLTGFGLVLAGPILVLAGAVGIYFELPPVPSIAAGIAVVLATGLAVWSQEVMGAAWRPDISPSEEAALVRNGPFRLVRNPNYLAMLIAAGGGTLISPTAVGGCGVLILLGGLLLTARAEEPLLSARYGDQYRSYAATTGRFVPGIGRIRAGGSGGSSANRPKGHQ